MRWYLSVVPQSGSAETLPERIVLVKKGEAPVATLAIATAEGYGTIYTESSYVMPQGVVGYAVTQADTDRRELSLTEAYVGGETVPAHTALLVKGEKRNYLLFAPTPQSAEGKPAPQGNLLLGTATEAQTAAPNGESADTYRFYKLYYADPDHTGTKRLGFYWGASEGAPLPQSGPQSLFSPDQRNGHEHQWLPASRRRYRHRHPLSPRYAAPRGLHPHRCSPPSFHAQ